MVEQSGLDARVAEARYRLGLSSNVPDAARKESVDS